MLESFPPDRFKSSFEIFQLETLIFWEPPAKRPLGQATIRCKVVEARKLVEDARNRSAGAICFFRVALSSKLWASGDSPAECGGNLPNSAGSRRSNRSSTRRKTLSASKWRSSKSRPALHSAKFPHPSEGFLTTGKTQDVTSPG